ncbi:MAG: hypothetical protein R3F62_08540 [Planctomycetota bacterium]
MKRLTWAIVAVGLAGAAWGQEGMDDRREQRRAGPSRTTVEHLELLEGRALYRLDSVTLRDRWPFLIAATEAEREAGQGIAVGVETAAEIFRAPDSEEAALELARLLGGGTAVPDAATYGRLREAAAELAGQGGRWGIEVADGQPAAFGEAAQRTKVGFEVQRLVYLNDGFGALDVEAQRFYFPAEGAAQLERTRWIGGPPQTWQTAGEVDSAEQTALQDEVDRFAEAMTHAFTPTRTIETFVEACADETKSFAQLRKALGPPDADVGSGIHIYRYTLNDGSWVVFGVSDEDAPPLYVRQVQTGRGRPEWKLLRTLR